VHLDSLVPGRALAEDGRWVPVKARYLFPVRALSRHSNDRLVSALRGGELSPIDASEVSRMLDALMAEEWAVYAKPCLAHTESVIGYRPATAIASR